MAEATRMVENSAKAVVLDGTRVLLMRYHDREMGLGTWYSLPGGRQRFGETLEEAVVRECLEEIGAEVAPTRLLFVREYVHARHQLAGKGRDQHKVEFYFLCGLISPVDLSYAADAAVADEGQGGLLWCDLHAVNGLQIFPTGLRNLASLIEGNASAVYWGDAY
jgi:8-oxo-dGTP diphosphatase